MGKFGDTGLSKVSSNGYNVNSTSYKCRSFVNYCRKRSKCVGQPWLDCPTDHIHSIRVVILSFAKKALIWA